MFYINENLKIDKESFLLLNNNKKIEVEPLVFDLIIYLIENRNNLVSRNELLENVWQGRTVLDATLSNHIKTARNVLGDDGTSQSIIKTIHGRGYRFIAHVEEKTDQIENTNNRKPKLIKKIPLFGLSFIILGLVALIINNYFDKGDTITKTINENISIAVLAFLDLSTAGNQAYFSEGISEEILNKLTKIPKLRVISRTSSFYFKNKKTTVKEIGEQLKVSHVLEGSVRKQDNKVRITVQLIETKTSNHLWSETYDKSMDDIFQIQDDIAQVVSEKLRLSLLPSQQNKTIVDSGAYSLLLKARHLSHTKIKENYKKSELITRKSIAFDPNYAASWHHLAFIVFESTFSFGMRSYNDGIKTSTYAIGKALELNPNSGRSYALLARIQSQERRFEDSEINMQKALKLDSKNSRVMDYAALNAMFAGDLEKSLQYRLQLLDVNPKHFYNYFSIGQLSIQMQKYDQAYDYLNQYLSYNSNSAMTHNLLSSTLLAQGKNQQALEHANKEKSEFWKHYALCMVEFAMGNKQRANELLDEFIELHGHTDLTNIARIYAFRGEYEKSFEWLDKAFNHPDSTLIGWLSFPEFKNMHNDPRWKDLIIKMKFPKSHWLMKQLR